MRNDPERLARLQRLLILDSPAERAYDDITRALASTFDVPIAMVNLLDADRDWFKSRVGFPHPQSPVAMSFCQAFLDSADDVIVAQDTLADARFAQHPLVIGAPFVRFYAAARLVVDGQTVGTLCAYDLQPKTVSAERVEQLQTMARAVAELLAQRRR